MTHSKFYLLFFTVLLSCTETQNDQEGTTDSIRVTDKKKVASGDYFNLADQSQDNLYSDFFDTSLKGNFSITYSSDSVNQFLIYKTKNITVDTIAQCYRGLPFKTLGYIIADFDKIFVFAQYYGARNPTVIQLYRKDNAEALIKEGSALIGIDDTKEIVLFSENDVPNLDDSLTLYDIRSNSKKKYEFPKDVFGEAQVCNRVHLKDINSESFILEYELNNRQELRQKKYSR